MESFDDIKKQAKDEADAVLAAAEAESSAARQKTEALRTERAALEDHRETIQPLELRLQLIDQKIQLLEDGELLRQAESPHKPPLPINLRMAQQLREQLKQADEESDRAQIQALINEKEGEYDELPDSYKQTIEDEQQLISLKEERTALQEKYEEAVHVFTERHGVKPDELPKN